LLQVDLQRIILVYVMEGIFVIYFSLIAFQILRRKRQRLNIVLSAFFISISIANILNMIYAIISEKTTVLILNFLTNFLLCFGPVFIFMVNMIILESTLIFSVKRQNRFILIYGIIAFIGMLIIFVFFDGVNFDRGYPAWKPIFFWYVVIISTSFAVLPFFYTALKIYFSFETKALKKKWSYYFLGSVGAISIGYMAFVNNLLNNPAFRLILSIYGISVIIWGYLMYYGIGFKLKP